MALAEVLRAVGDDDAAADETRRALELCERKGATALAELTARRLPDATQPAADASATGLTRPKERDRGDVRENLASAAAHRIAAMFNAGDVAGIVQMAGTSTTHLHEVGELTPEQVRALVPGSPGCVTVLHRHPPRHVGRAPPPLPRFRHGRHHAGSSPSPGASRGWRTSASPRSTDEGSQGPAWIFPGTHVVQAVIELYQRFAASGAEPGPEQDQALVAAQAVAAWCAANEQVVIDDVLELDLDHVVLVAREDDQPATSSSGSVGGSGSPDPSRCEASRTPCASAASTPRRRPSRSSPLGVSAWRSPSRGPSAREIDPGPSSSSSRRSTPRVATSGASGSTPAASTPPTPRSTTGTQSPTSRRWDGGLWTSTSTTTPIESRSTHTTRRSSSSRTTGSRVMRRARRGTRSSI